MAAPVLLGCGDFSVEAPPNTSSPRLRARPGEPAETPSLGLSRLNLGDQRDGILYVPQSYDPDVATPLFVALHGAGGSGEDWQSYPARAETRGMILLAPDSRGITWDLLRGGFGADVDFLDLALQFTFDRCRVDPTRLALGGFSDGASYALSLGVSNGDLFSHLVAYSPGFFRSEDTTAERPPVYISHGTDDSILPVTVSRDDIVPRLRSAGHEVTYREFDGGHEVPSDISESALDWFIGTG